MSKIIKFLKKEDSSFVLLNKELYLKILFIESDITDSMLTLVDDNDTFNTLFSKLKPKPYGYSFNVTSFFYKNKLANEIVFSLNVVPFYKNRASILKNFNKLLLCIEKRYLKKSNNTLDLIFLGATPGGFRCIYLGIVGFLSKKQFFIGFLEKEREFLAKFTKNYFVNFCFYKNYFNDFIKRISGRFFVRVEERRLLYEKSHYLKLVKERGRHFNSFLHYSFVSRDYSFKDTGFNLKKCDRKKRVKTTVFKK